MEHQFIYLTQLQVFVLLQKAEFTYQGSHQLFLIAKVLIPSSSTWSPLLHLLFYRS